MDCEPDGGQYPEEGIDLVVLWKVCRRYRSLIAICTVVCAAGSAIYAFTATKMWRAEVTITAARDSNMGAGANIAGQLGGLASLAGVTLGGTSAAAREAQAILKSRWLAEIFIQRHGLTEELLSDSKPPRTLWRAVAFFRKKVLDIDEDRRTELTTVSIYWRNPQEAATWANEYVALANEVVRNRAAADARRNIGYLENQLKQTSAVEVQHALYNLVESETKTLMLAEGRAEYAFSTIDPAVPPELSASPRKPIVIAVGVVVGIFIGVLTGLARYKIGRYRGSIEHSPLAAP